MQTKNISQTLTQTSEAEWARLAAGPTQLGCGRGKPGFSHPPPQTNKASVHEKSSFAEFGIYEIRYVLFIF